MRAREPFVHLSHLLAEGADLTFQPADGAALPVKRPEDGDQQQDDKAQKAEEVVIRLGNQRCSL